MLWLACLNRSSQGPFQTASSDVASGSSPYYVGRDGDDSNFAMRIWMETVAIEQALDAHTCLSEQGTMYQVMPS